jgi:tetratricopeptide (TPR) repeat protein
MRRRLFGFLTLLLMALPLLAAAAGTQILLVARDLEGRPLAGLRFTCRGSESLSTTRTGTTQLDLQAKLSPGQQIEIGLVAGAKQAEEWFLVNSLVNIPADAAEVKVVLMRRSAFRQIAADARDATRQEASGPAELTAEDRKRVLNEAAARHGLTAEQLETALRSFAETQDPKDKGIAAYLEGEDSQAEDLLKKAAEKKESDFVETLRYLGASQYELAKYRDAADTFRKALALRGEDPVLLSWLGNTLHELAEWTEAEALTRRALEIDEKSFGPEHPKVAIRLNNLAQLFEATNRLAEAEPLMRRVVAIFENSLGEDHPSVAFALNNLAQLLQDTNRLAEAEPLMRRALAIDEKSYGQEHPKVATALNNLAQLLQATNRLSEAEPLMRRVVAILESSLGEAHANFAAALNSTLSDLWP